MDEEERPDEATVAARGRMQASFRLAYRGHPEVLERTLDILHFFGPAQNERDIALQNAAKSLLHEGGWWGDSDDDRAEIVRKLTGLDVPRRSLWQRIFGR